MAFDAPSLDYYKVRCESKLETRTSIKSLTVVQSGSIVVQNVSYQEFPNGKVEVSKVWPSSNQKICADLFFTDRFGLRKAFDRRKQSLDS